MHCHEDLVSYLSCGMMLAGLGHLVHHKKIQTSYGRHMGRSPPARTVPARLAWFLQEMPALLAPLLLTLSRHRPSTAGKNLLLWTFCMHYFQRTFVYSLLTRGTPFPLGVMLSAGVICSLNGLLQGHYLLHCAQLDEEWPADYRYKIGGLFEYVSGANYLGEIVEWFGYAVATWSLPALSFAVFSLCFIGPRAYHHHRSRARVAEQLPLETEVQATATDARALLHHGSFHAICRVSPVVSVSQIHERVPAVVLQRGGHRLQRVAESVHATKLSEWLHESESKSFHHYDAMTLQVVLQDWVHDLLARAELHLIPDHPLAEL
ncbi:3-oxo-5-alpha-steroid 4-dehydrogenase 2 [Liparis tanakae]|uniref:3-oxo-5-alpha-steroid 4-dehydrogenase 2 n=1 Tax=Liparis tanakae TaxID=230148 RepID=A0A4Z2I8N6_9TELE|nr:3-oxo-5-alpha-steroid 4-dehydrogenase 2 [Liparis tanakae]